MNAEHYFATAKEREIIRRKREDGVLKPWTEDKIFRIYRFTNVHRENDKTTRWFRENVRQPLSIQFMEDPTPEKLVKIVESTIIFRWFNRVESMRLVTDLLLGEWDTEEARRRLQNISPIVTGAYMMHSPYGYSKLDGMLIAIDWARPKLAAMVARWGSSQEEAWRDLCTLNNMGSFSAGEVIWDLRWTPVLNHAIDIPNWTIAGPGCARGLGYVMADNPALYNYGSKADQVVMLKVMQELLEMSKLPEYWPSDWEPWELHEAEMWACEYCKYRTAQVGGRLKRKFQ